MRWKESIPMPHENGDGSGFFPKRNDGKIPEPRSRDGII
jgi:hypothetical protein